MQKIKFNHNLTPQKEPLQNILICVLPNINGCVLAHNTIKG